MIQIEFARGDSYQKGFVLKRDGETVGEQFEDVYFTVKKYHSDHDYVFQKRMTTGGIVYNGDGHYTMYIDPEDTNLLAFGDYDCDIEFRKEGYKKTFYGKLKLSKEVTHYYNE